MSDPYIVNQKEIKYTIEYKTLLLLNNNLIYSIGSYKNAIETTIQKAPKENSIANLCGESTTSGKNRNERNINSQPIAKQIIKYL